MKAILFQMSPQCVHIRNVEDQPAPSSHRLTLFQIEDRRLWILRPKRRETCALSTVEKFHAQNIPVKTHRFCHVRNAKSDRGKFFNCRRHAHEFTASSA